MATILLVDDDQAVRNSITAGLAAEGHTIHAAGDVVSALDVFRTNKSAIDFSILSLEGQASDKMDVELAMNLHKEKQGIPIILVTASQDRLTPQDHLYFADVVEKPYYLAERILNTILPGAIEALYRRSDLNLRRDPLKTPSPSG